MLTLGFIIMSGKSTSDQCFCDEKGKGVNSKGACLCWLMSFQGDPCPDGIKFLNQSVAVSLNELTEQEWWIFEQNGFHYEGRK